MKIAEYNDMMAHLTRRNYSNGTEITPKPKPGRSLQEKLNTLKKVARGLSPDSRVKLMTHFLNEAVQKGEITQEQRTEYVMPFFGETGEKVTKQIDQYEDRNNFAIGGGAIEGTNLGTREGFAEPITNEQFKKLYTKFQKDKNNIGTDAEFAAELNKKYETKKGNKFTTRNIYRIRKELGIKTAVKGGQPPPAVMEQFNKVTKYLEELIPKLNEGEKYYTGEQVSSMVEKKFNLEPKYKTVDGVEYKVNKFTKDRYPVMATLDSVETKLDNTLKNMLLEDKPLNDFWYDALQKRTGLDQRTLTKYLPNIQTYQVIKDQGAYALKQRFNFPKNHGFLKDKSFKDQLTTALEMEKGLPVFTGEKAESISAPRTKVMDFAKRSWNANRGQGDVVFYKKGSKKPITWDFGVTLPYDDVYFTYGGKKYSSQILSDIDLIKKDFPEVYQNQTAINNLKRYQIVDPLNKNKKISVGKLIERNQVNNYKWKPSGTLDILHGPEGVKNKPFTGLSFSSRDINTLQNNISVSVNIPENKKSQLIGLIDKVASGDPLNIVTRQANIARKKTGFNTMLNQIIDEVQTKGTVSKNKLSEIINVYTADKNKLGKELNFYCNLASRKKLSTSMVPGATCSAADIERGMRADAKTPGGRERLAKVAKNFGKVFGKIVAPIDIGIEGAFALPHLLRGDAKGAIAATTAGLFGAGDTMKQVGEKFGTDSSEYALYGSENALQKKMTAIAGLDNLLMQNRQLGIIPEESGEFKKGIGRQPQEEALRKNFATSFINLSKLDKEATEEFGQYYPLTADLTQRNKAIQNIRNFSDEIQATGMFKNVRGPSDQKTIKGFLETSGGKSKFPILPRLELPAFQEQALDYTGMGYLDRYADLPINIASQVPAYEKSLLPSEEETQLRLMQNLGELKMGDVNRVLSDANRKNFSEGSDDPESKSRRKFIKQVGIGGGIIGALGTGLLKLGSVVKGTKKVEEVVQQSRAEKIFFDLVNNVKAKGTTSYIDKGVDMFEYKGVKVYEGPSDISVEFQTDKGAPAFIEYQKPEYVERAGEAKGQTEMVETTGEFMEGQQVGRYDKDGDVDLDTEFEIIDDISEVEKIAKGEK